jgi:WhiB family transcriptional regulator, redox-sensing transcriptional regulator
MTGITEPKQAGAARIPAMPPGRGGATRSAAAFSGWMSRGACRSEDTELFFPIAATGPALPQISAAKQVCQRCTVCALCLAYALETRQAGIWGGTTAEERHAMRRPSGWRGEQASPWAVRAHRHLPDEPADLPSHERQAVIHSPSRPALPDAQPASPGGGAG